MCVPDADIEVMIPALVSVICLSMSKIEFVTSLLMPVLSSRLPILSLPSLIPLCVMEWTCLWLPGTCLVLLCIAIGLDMVYSQLVSFSSWLIRHYVVTTATCADTVDTYCYDS
jgi:hypothetical protein